MTYLSLFEKIKILFNTIFDFKVVLVFSIIMLILTILYMVRVLNKKKYTLSMIGSFITVFAISIISNFKILSKTFDNFTTIFFRNIYFPSIYVYIAMLVINLITFITSILNRKLGKVYKVLNSINFVLGNIILVVILNIIAKNKIDIFSISSLYTNTTLVAVLELSMNIFILWILSLIGVYTTNVICDSIMTKKDKKKVTPVIEVTKEEIEKESILDKVSEVVKSIKNNKVKVQPITEVNSSIEAAVEADNDILDTTEVISEIDSTIEEVEEVAENTSLEVVEDTKVEDNKISFNDLLNGNIPLVYYDNNNNIEEEYKIADPEEIYGSYNNISVPRTMEVKITKANNFVKDEEGVDKKIDNTISNTISLDDLIKGENIIEEVKNDVKKDIVKTITNSNIDERKIVKNDKYTIEDYKKMIGMLKELKSHSHNSNISVDEAVTLSLISDYSIDDCLKFKELLESNLN